jgi:hypothetical protein
MKEFVERVSRGMGKKSHSSYLNEGRSSGGLETVF